MSRAGGRSCPVSLESARLRLRVPRVEDAPAVNAAIVETFESLHRWMPWAASLPSVAETATYLRGSSVAFIERTELNYLLLRRDDGSVVGICGLHHIDWSVPKLEIGYWCRTRDQGQGYVSEAVRALAGMVFSRLGAERLELHCDTENRASRRVAERCGFRLEGTLRHDRRAHDGSLADTAVYGLLAEEYRRLAARASDGASSV